MIRTFVLGLYEGSGLAAVQSPWIAWLFIFLALWIVFVLLGALAAPVVRIVAGPSTFVRAVVATVVLALGFFAVANALALEALTREAFPMAQQSGLLVLYQLLLYAATLGIGALVFRIAFRGWIMPNSTIERDARKSGARPSS